MFIWQVVQPKGEKRKHSPCEWQDLHSHSFPSHSCCLLLLALAPGAWHWFFWLSDWFNSPSVPLLHSTYRSPSLCLVYCAPRPFSVLQLAQQVSGIVMWNPVRQKWSNRIAYLCWKIQVIEVHRANITNLVEYYWTKTNGKDKVKLTLTVHLGIIPSCEEEEEKNSEGAGTCSKPCTTTLKCLQPSLHEGCQGLHSNRDQGTSLLSFCASCEIMWRKW